MFSATLEVLVVATYLSSVIPLVPGTLVFADSLVVVTLVLVRASFRLLVGLDLVIVLWLTPQFVLASGLITKDVPAIELVMMVIVLTVYDMIDFMPLALFMVVISVTPTTYYEVAADFDRATLLEAVTSVNSVNPV